MGGVAADRRGNRMDTDAITAEQPGDRPVGGSGKAGRVDNPAPWSSAESELGWNRDTSSQPCRSEGGSGPQSEELKAHQELSSITTAG